MNNIMISAALSTAFGRAERLSKPPVRKTVEKNFFVKGINKSD